MSSSKIENNSYFSSLINENDDSYTKLYQAKALELNRKSNKAESKPKQKEIISNRNIAKESKKTITELEEKKETLKFLSRKDIYDGRLKLDFLEESSHITNDINNNENEVRMPRQIHSTKSKIKSRRSKDKLDIVNMKDNPETKKLTTSSVRRPKQLIFPKKSSIKSDFYLNINHKKEYNIREDILYNIVNDIHSKSESGVLLSKIKRYQIFSSILIFINIIFTFVDNEIYIDLTNTFLNDYMNVSNINLITKDVLSHMQTRKLSLIENIIRFINGIIVLTCFIFNIQIYRLKTKILINSRFISSSKSFINSLTYKSFIYESFLILIYLPPFINIVFTGEFESTYWSYSLNSIISLLIMFKLYFIILLWSNVSKWTTDSASTICRKYHVRTGLLFALKCDLKIRPFLVLGVLMGTVLLICSFTLRTFEFGVKSFEDKTFIGNNPFQNLNNCVYFIFFTIATVGYGDFVPRSILGRIIAIVSMIVGAIILALIIASLSVMSEFNNGEKKAYSKLKKLLAVDNAMIKAGMVLKTTLFLRGMLNKNKKINNDENQNELSQKDHEISKSKHSIKSKTDTIPDRVKKLTQKFVIITQLKRDISIFKNDYKIAKSLSIPLDETLNLINKQVSRNIENLTFILNSYNSADESISNILKDSIASKERIKDILRMQTVIGDYLIENNNLNYMMKNNLKFEMKGRCLTNANLTKNKSILKKAFQNTNQVDASDMPVNSNNKAFININNKESEDDMNDNIDGEIGELKIGNVMIMENERSINLNNKNISHSLSKSSSLNL